MNQAWHAFNSPSKTEQDKNTSLYIYLSYSSIQIHFSNLIQELLTKYNDKEVHPDSMRRHITIRPTIFGENHAVISHAQWKCGKLEIMSNHI